MKAAKPKTGRPPLPPGEKLERRVVYLKPDHWVKFDALGGNAWLRALIDRAKPPK